MKAVRVHETGAPDVMKVEEVGDPTAGAGEVLVKVHAIGVNPVDTYVRSGNYPLRVPLPYTPGMDAAGVVDIVGEGVVGLKPGDRVYVAGCLTGAYAEKTLCRAAQVHPLPDQVGFSEGAAIGVPYGTAWRALLQKARGVDGENLLVHGASGGVGIAAVQIGLAAGLTVIGTAGTEKGRKLVLEQGAHHVLDHTSSTYQQEAMDLTGGKGFNVILEMLANVNLDRDLQMIAMHGRIVVIGNRGRIEIDPRMAMGREATIMGMVLMNTSETDLMSIHAAIGAGLAAGTFKPVIGKEFSLADAPKAHEAVMQPGAYGKIVLVP